MYVRPVGRDPPGRSEWRRIARKDRRLQVAVAAVAVTVGPRGPAGTLSFFWISPIA